VKKTDMRKMRIPEDIERKISFDSRSGCWLWTGCENGRGYGVVFLNGTKTYVHRYLYELMVSTIPEGMELDHLCRTPACVNPTHLDAVTHQQNMRRHGATKTMCKHGHKYTPENTYFRPGGSRYCRRCQMGRCQEYYYENVSPNSTSN
jgi:hypothetical protein